MALKMGLLCLYFLESSKPLKVDEGGGFVSLYDEEEGRKEDVLSKCRSVGQGSIEKASGCGGLCANNMDQQ